MAKPKPKAPELSNERRLALALGAAWEVDALARAMRDQVGRLNNSDIGPEIHMCALLDRLFAVASALMDAAQVGEGDAAEIERVLRFAPSTEVSNG